MENYVLEVSPKKEIVLQMFKISFRVHCEDNDTLMSWYINNFSQWLQFHDLELLYCTNGIHRDTGKTHFHFHTLVYGVLFKKSYVNNPIVLFKQDYNLGKVKSLSTSHLKIQDGLQYIPKDCYSEKYGTKSNISIKLTLYKDAEDAITFLQYPLKEGNYIPYHIQLEETSPISVNLDQLTKNAQAEYRVAKRKAEKFKEKKIVQENSWADLVKYLDEQGCADKIWTQIYYQVLSYYHQIQKKPPTFRKMENDADAYAFYRQTPDFTIHQVMDRAGQKKFL